ncbi:AGAP012094-PA, partial [Anopheles gambiae str. PEST]
FNNKKEKKDDVLLTVQCKSKLKVCEKLAKEEEEEEEETRPFPCVLSLRASAAIVSLQSG